MPTVNTLIDGDGFIWDFTDSLYYGSNVINGTYDAFDGGLQLSVNGTVFSGAFGASELDGRQLVVTGSVGSIEVERRLYVPDDAGDGWARLLESFTNTGSSAVTITVTVMSNSGNDGGMQVLGTSSGDTGFTTADRWIVNDDSSTGDGGWDPTVAHIFTDGTLAPTSVGTTVFDAASNHGIAYTFTLTIQPGETVSILHYATQQSDMAGINSELPTLADPDAAALFGLTADQLNSIANFDVGTTRVEFDTLSSVDLNNPSYIYYLPDETGFYGQTFTATSANLATIEFAVDFYSGTGPMEMTVMVATVRHDSGGFHPDDVMYQSALLTIAPDSTGAMVISVDTSGLSLVPGQQYVILFNSNSGDGPEWDGILAFVRNPQNDAEYFVYNHTANQNDQQAFDQPYWYQNPADGSGWGDIAIRLTYGGAPADTTPPAAPTLDLDAVADSGVSDSDDLTNDSTPSLSGTAEAGSTVTVYEGTTELGTATADGDGNWALTLAAALSDGEHTLTATATDEPGNVSDASAGLTVTIDTATPDPTIGSTSPTSDTTPVLAGTAEAGASVEITNADGNVVATVTADGDGNWSHELAELMDGDYDYWATATDSAGNVSNAIATTVSVVVPGITVPGANGGGTVEGTPGRDDLSGGNGTDILDGGWAPDILRGNNGADTLLGGAGDDSLYGGNGADVMDGGDDDDLMVGGRGDDLMTGGDGADLFVIGGSDGNDTITDFEAGEDSLQLNDGLTVTSLVASGDDTLVHLSNGGVLTLSDVSIVSVDLLMGA